MTTKERVGQLGTTFDYTRYFERRRSKLFNQRKKCAKEFMEKLEMAIIVTVRMTGGDVGKILNLNNRKPMNRNKVCNVCQASVTNSCKQQITHFKAKRVKRTNDYSSDEGFLLDWVHEEASRAEELGPFEWLSGPLLLCTDCLKTMYWYEDQTHCKHIQLAIEQRDTKQLPPLFGYYSSLEKSLRLAEFFGLQVASLLRNPETNERSLNEIKRCIANSCGVISVIGSQISALGNNNVKQNSREFVLQRNIAQYCNHVVTELSCLFVIDPEKLASSRVVIRGVETGHLIDDDDTSILEDVWGGICAMFCGSARKQKSRALKCTSASNNNLPTVYFDKNK